MIVKDRNASDRSTRGRPAGPDAEMEIANRLRRAFAIGTAVLVLNDLRLPLPQGVGGHAQFDHVLIHRYGLIVIEAAAVASVETVAKVRGLTDVLRRVLTEQFDPHGLGRLAGLPIDGLVAVAGGTTLSQTCEIEAVPTRVQTLIEGYRAAPKRFDGHARHQVADHLIGTHAPRRPHGQSAAWVAPAAFEPRWARGKRSV